MKKKRTLYETLSTNIIGKKLQQARAERRYTQKQIGDVLKVSSQQVQKYESDTNAISIEKLTVLADFLGLDVRYFLSDDFASELKHKEQVANYLANDSGVESNQESYELFSLFSKHITPEQAQLLTNFIKSLDKSKS